MHKPKTMKVWKLLFIISTFMFTAVFLFSSYMYLFKYDSAVKFYNNLGFPVWMIYPSAIAKLLALLTIWLRPRRWLTEWAYAGLTFDAIMALTAHTIAMDGAGLFAIVAMAGLLISRFCLARINPEYCF